MAVHPLVGTSLLVLKWVRDQRGRRYVDLQHPGGFTMRVPIEWTDRSPPRALPQVEGRAVHLALGGLLQMANAVEVALGEKVDTRIARIKVDAKTKQAVGHGGALFGARSDSDNRMDNPSGEHASESGGRVGGTFAPDPSRGGRGRGKGP
jgi:hypothetical protein